MIKEKKFRSLLMKNAIFLIISMLVVVGQFFLNYMLTQTIISKVYCSDKYANQRQEKLANSLRNYVAENKVKSTDSKDILSWVRKSHYRELVVFKDGKVFFDSNYEYVDKDMVATYGDYALDDEAYYMETYNLYEVDFCDEPCDVCIIEYSESSVYTIMCYVCVIIGAFSMIALMYFSTKKMIKRLVRLSDEVSKIEGETLEEHINLSGNDEITQIAVNVDKMRERIITHMGKEKEAWAANSQLVTCMAHDLRTPLTVLTGYLEMLEKDQELSEEERKKYVEIAMSKADQLKTMSDRLFNFFLVYSNEDRKPVPEEYSSQVLIGQLVGEHVALLEEAGYTFEINRMEIDKKIFVDVDMMKRLFDNIFNNISKYADINSPVIIKYDESYNYLHINIKNKKSKPSPQVVSTKLGTKTCEKLARMINVQYSFEDKEEVYETCIRIPFSN